MENSNTYARATTGMRIGGPEKISWTTLKGALQKPSDTSEATLTRRMERYFTVQPYPSLASAVLTEMRFLTSDCRP